MTLLEDNDDNKSTSQMSYFCRINQGTNCEYWSYHQNMRLPSSFCYPYKRIKRLNLAGC